MFQTIAKIFKAEDISLGTKVLTFATAVRWAGWGFVENLIPIFLFSFSASYAEAGLLKSSLELSMILTMPLIGIFADRTRATTLVLLGLAFYMLVGVSYLLAGLTGLALFIILARIANGVGFGLDAIGRETYFRRSNKREMLASVFGYFDSLAMFWWVVASLVGIILIKYFSLPWLLFLITPTTLISFWIIKKWQAKEEFLPVTGGTKLKYREYFNVLGNWNYQLKMILVLNLILSASWSTLIFFLPIDMYTEGASYSTIILFGVVAALPVLFGIFWGRIFDKKGPHIFVYGLLMYGILLFLLAFGESFGMIIGIAFLIGIILEFISVGKEELITVHAKPEHFGQVGGFMRSVMNLGAMLGPLLAGIVIDSTGSMKIVFLGLSACMLLLSLSFALHGRLRHLQKMKTI